MHEPEHSQNHTATRCNTLQHAATRCNTLQHTTYCNTVLLCCSNARSRAFSASNSNTLQNNATNCSTLQHTTLSYTMQHTALSYTLQHTAVHCNTLQYTATHCSTLQHTTRQTATILPLMHEPEHSQHHKDDRTPPQVRIQALLSLLHAVLQFVAVCCSVLQRVAACDSVWQYLAVSVCCSWYSSWSIVASCNDATCQCVVSHIQIRRTYA